MKSEVNCFSCQKKIEVLLPLGRRDECPHCGADLHVCLNCKLYDRNSHHECRESSSDYVKEKDRSNFCDYFDPQSASGGASKSMPDFKAAAEALFKKQT